MNAVLAVSRADVVAEARTWIGTPWQHQARLKRVGVDCGGLPIGVARALALVPADMDVTHYARVPDGHSLVAHCRQWMVEIDPASIAPADVIVLRFDVEPQHVAIVGDYVHGGLSMIHALDRPGHAGGAVVEHRLDAAHRARIVAAFTLPGVA